MAQNITATLLQDAIVRVGNDKSFLDYEGRMDTYDVLKLANDGANKLLNKSEIERVKQSAAQNEKILALQRTNVTIRTDYSCDITPDGVTSTFVPVTYATLGFDIGVKPAINNGNYVSVLDDYEWQLKQGFRDTLASLNGTTMTFIEGKKSLTNVSPATVLPGSTFAAGVYTVPATEKNNFYRSIPAILRRNVSTYAKPVDLANTEAIIGQEYINHQGTANGQNLQYQTSNIGFYRDNAVPLATGMQETHYLMPEGAIGIYNWLPWEARVEQKITDAEGWTKIQDPIFGFDWWVHYKYDCVDGQFQQRWAVRASFALMSRYSSDANKSDIFKYQIANPA